MNASPSTALNGHVRHAETMVHFNGSGAPHHRTHLPSLITSDRRTLSLGRALPLAPEPPPPPAPTSHKAANGAYNGGLSGLFRGTSREVDWI